MILGEVYYEIQMPSTTILALLSTFINPATPKGHAYGKHILLEKHSTNNAQETKTPLPFYLFVYLLSKLLYATAERQLYKQTCRFRGSEIPASSMSINIQSNY